MVEVYAPELLWDTPALEGKGRLYISSKLEAVAFVALTREHRDEVNPAKMTIGGEVFLRVNLRIYAWVVSRIDRLHARGVELWKTHPEGSPEREKFQRVYDDAGDRIDRITRLVTELELFRPEDARFAWEQRVAQESFRPLFE